MEHALIGIMVLIYIFPLAMLLRLDGRVDVVSRGMSSDPGGKGKAAGETERESLVQVPLVRRGLERFERVGGDD